MIDKTKRKIAVDIVLLLPPEVVKKCIFINSQLDNSDYVSFVDGYNPHITLGMGCIDIKDLETLKNKIQSALVSIHQLKLTILDFKREEFFSFRVARNKEIMELHLSVMKVLEDISTYGNATPEMFNESEKVKNNSHLLDWVNNFSIKYSKDEYDPHISIGKGERASVDFPIPIEFIAQKIGIFHLGAHGTCKEKLAEFTLN